MALICPKCGAENRDAAKFCLKCAHQLVALAPVPAPADPPRKRRRKRRPAAEATAAPPVTPAVAPASAPAPAPAPAAMIDTRPAAPKPARPAPAPRAPRPDPAPAPPPAAPQVASPRPAPPPAPASPPAGLCADSRFLAHALCLQRECGKPALQQHPQCVRMREQQRAIQQGSGDG